MNLIKNVFLVGVAALVLVGCPYYAFADSVRVLSTSPTYETIVDYDTVSSCTKPDGGDILKGAIIGGLIGNNFGGGSNNGRDGALLGGALSGLSEKCSERQVERRRYSVQTGWNVELRAPNGTIYTVYLEM